jgi:hypothetical protein
MPFQVLPSAAGKFNKCGQVVGEETGGIVK